MRTNKLIHCALTSENFETMNRNYSCENWLNIDRKLRSITKFAEYASNHRKPFSTKKKTDMKILNKRFCYQSAQFYVIDFPLCRSLSLFSSPSLAKRLMRCNWCAYMSFFLYLKATAPRVSAFNDFIVHMDALEIVDWIISIQKCARSLS